MVRISKAIGAISLGLVERSAMSVRTGRNARGEVAIALFRFASLLLRPRRGTDWCRANGLDYILGVAPTTTLRRHIENLETRQGEEGPAEPQHLSSSNG